MTSLYAPATHSIQTKAYARELIGEAVANGATAIHLGSLNFIHPQVVAELQTLADEHDLEYVDPPESIEHLLQGSSSSG